MSADAAPLSRAVYHQCRLSHYQLGELFGANAGLGKNRGYGSAGYCGGHV
jgi:hypothetical protein